jgi:hypothetical protein
MWILESMNPKKSRTMEILETTSSGNHRVDRDGGVISDVKVLGRKSGNGRQYSDRAIRDAARLYEGIDVHIDHPKRREMNVPRGFAEWAGTLKDVQVREDGVYADLHILKEHKLAAQIMEAADRMPEHFGLSHNAQARMTGPRGNQVVESLESVRSVDIVRKPATVAGLFESIEIEETDSMSTQTIHEAIREEYPKTAEEGIQFLLEQDGVAAMIPSDAAMPDGGGSALEGVKQSLADEAVKIFMDPNIDPKETGKQVGELAKVAEQVAAKLEGKKEVPEKADDAPADEEKVADMKESLDPEIEVLKKQVDALTHDGHVRNVLEDMGISRTEVGDRRFKMLQEAGSPGAVNSLLESWPDLLNKAKLADSLRARNTQILEEQRIPETPKAFAKSLRQ